MQEVTIKRGGCTYRCYLKNYGKGRGKGYRIFCPKVDAKCKPGTAPTVITPTPEAERILTLKIKLQKMITDTQLVLVSTYTKYKQENLSKPKKWCY